MAHPTNHKTALLLGAYGQTNLGDDLLMYNYLHYVKGLGYTHIYVNASEAQYVPKIIADEFPEMNIFETYNTSFLHMLRLMLKADCIFYGGGTVYKELYATTGRSRYTVIVRVMLFNMLARLVGKKIMGLHIGIGTIKTAFGRFVTGWALGSSTHTTFRDNESYVYARDVLKLPERIISHSTDGLFLNTRWRKEWHTATLAVDRKTVKRVVGINVLSDIPDWVDRDAYITAMRAFIHHLLKDNFVVLLPFQTGFNKNNDLAFMEAEIIPYITGSKNYTVADDLDISNVTSYFKQIDVLVGMRFHSLLLAAAAHTPFLAIAYDTKCWRFVSEVGYPHAIKIEDVAFEPTPQQTVHSATKIATPLATGKARPSFAEAEVDTTQPQTTGSEKLIQAYHALIADVAQAKTTLQKVEKDNYKTADIWKKSRTA